MAGGVGGHVDDDGSFDLGAGTHRHGEQYPVRGPRGQRTADALFLVAQTGGDRLRHTGVGRGQARARAGCAARVDDEHALVVEPVVAGDLLVEQGGAAGGARLDGEGGEVVGVGFPVRSQDGGAAGAGGEGERDGEGDDGDGREDEQHRQDPPVHVSRPTGSRSRGWWR
ncbi:hypothetical protein MYP14_03955 [Rhodococcus pyridinivorans]|uniref:hypothetical protein n=1 Tax=Rhodococcus pyridinivorans TaxID=103816 RepID=UPI0020000AF2|nr:hypothetical protein [Rhodococcus pyridinivorans]UPK64537.1 hypothetical protein MYP14_03955 [Rhodococcus pyridinivorans]